MYFVGTESVQFSVSLGPFSYSATSAYLQTCSRIHFDILHYFPARSDKQTPTMDFFTQTVDASLWSSRTYEDPEYDGDSVSATASRLPFTATGDICATKQLIVACGSDAIRAVTASTTLPEVGSFGNGDSRVPIYGNNEVTVACADIPASHSVQLVDALFTVIQPAKTMVLTSIARWSLRGRPEPGVFWLRSSSLDKPAADELRAPSFLTGCPAALLTESILSRRELAVATLVKDGSSTCYGDILTLREVLLKAWKNESWLVEVDTFEKDVRQQLKVERASSSAMYM